MRKIGVFPGTNLIWHDVHLWLLSEYTEERVRSKGLFLQGKSSIGARMANRKFCYYTASIVALLTVLSGCASSIEDADHFTGDLAPGKGIVVVVIDTTTPLYELRFSRPDDTFTSVASQGVAAGRTIMFLSLPAGIYTWNRADLPCFRGPSRFAPPCEYLKFDFDAKRKYSFTVKSGIVNYPGDLQVSYYYGYRTELVDRTAMLLRDLTDDQRKSIKRFGLRYSGFGDDTFYPYYLSLTSAKGGGQ